MKPKIAHATLHDVAELAGVSHQTVSRVINDSPRVSENTRQRVLEAIQQLNYQPNHTARALATRRSLTLEIVTFGVGYYGPAQMMGGVERAAKARGYRLFFSNLDRLTYADMRETVEDLKRQQVEGVVLIAPVRSVLYEELIKERNNIPVVQLATQKDVTFPSIIIDQHLGSRLATQHLIDTGHSSIAAISGPLHWNDAAARHEGWLDTLQDNHLNPVNWTEGDWSAASGYRAAHELLDHGAKFTALVIANDQMALGAILALRERGLHIPKDVSIVGFDDIPEASFFDPPLTTIRQDFSTLGEQSVEYLVEIIADPQSAAGQRVLTPRLILRKSHR